MRSRLRLDIGWRALLWAAAGPPARGAQIAAAKARLARQFDGGAIVIGQSARTIFDALLTELAPPAGSHVLMSGVNIQNMADIVRSHGLEVTGAEIDIHTLAPAPGALLAAQQATGASVCVVAQLFGAVAGLADAAALRDRGVFVVEDAAQAFAGGAYRGSPDAGLSLFSFGPIKRRTALGGAIALCRDVELARRLQARLDAYPQLSAFWYRRRALNYLCLKALGGPVAFSVLYGLLALLRKDPDKVFGGIARGFPGPWSPDAIRRRPPGRLISLLARQVERRDDHGVRIERCREILEGLPRRAIVGDAVERHAFWLLPVLSPRPDLLVTHLRRAGFDATRGATSLRALCPDATPQAQRLMSGVVYIPHPVDLGGRARARLVEAMAEARAAKLV